jgi:RNA polymerase sigma-70 factor (ECF subfamily)
MTPPPSNPGNCSCPTTDWSEVERAAHGPNDTAGRVALANLCLRYWHPIYAYIRRRKPEDQAQDLTQEFFARIVLNPKNKLLAAADPQKGSFRAYLFTTCWRFLVKKWKEDQKEVLNGPVLSLGAFEPAAPESASEFDSYWAYAVLKNALEALRSQYADRDKAALFDGLRAYLPLRDGELPGRQAEAAERLGITVGYFKKLLNNLRQEFAGQVRHELAQTLSDPEDVGQEIGRLLASVRCLPDAAAAPPDQAAQEAR